MVWGHSCSGTTGRIPSRTTALRQPLKSPFDLIAKLFLKVFHLTLIHRKIQPRSNESLRIMLTGSFHSDNWIRTHLMPLAQCRRVEEVVFIGNSPIPEMAGARGVQPPAWLTSLLGSPTARLILFFVCAIRERPDYLGGFHLQFNGLAAIWLARLLRRRSIYICGGGPLELQDGGIRTENALFRRLSGPDPRVESSLVRAAAAADLIVVMGNSARDWFEVRCPDSVVAVIPGGFPTPSLAKRDKAYDLVTVGRLYRFKRYDRLLEMLAVLADRQLTLTLAIVGDGSDRADLEELAKSLGVSSQVTFAGWQSDVEKWLAQGRVFVLTSDSEGLSQAVVQALLQGLPVIASSVGDLRDVVKPGVNGALVETLTPDAFANAVEEIMSDPATLKLYSANARPSVEHLYIHAVADLWGRLFAELDGQAPS